MLQSHLAHLKRLSRAPSRASSSAMLLLVLMCSCLPLCFLCTAMAHVTGRAAPHIGGAIHCVLAIHDSCADRCSLKRAKCFTHADLLPAWAPGQAMAQSTVATICLASSATVHNNTGHCHPHADLTHDAAATRDCGAASLLVVRSNAATSEQQCAVVAGVPACRL